MDGRRPIPDASDGAHLEPHTQTLLQAPGNHLVCEISALGKAAEIHEASRAGPGWALGLRVAMGSPQSGLGLGLREDVH